MRNNIISNPNFRLYESEEIWVRKTPQRGDHIRVNRGLYNHHGVYISDDEVIHFTGRDGDNVLDWSKPEVISTDLDYFLKGDILEVKEYTDEEINDLYPTEHIVQYARACLGDKGYNLIFNNCEHFANTCTLGRFRSKQVERIFDSINSVNDLPTYKGGNMGILGTIGGAIRNFFGGGSGGSRSTSNTTYEPDKVKVAQIESDTKIRLAEMESERVDLIKNAQIDLLEFNTNCQIAIEEARARSLNSMAQAITNLQTQLNEVGVKRLEIIEKGSMSLIEDIEHFYGELSDKIEEDNYKYTEEKLPKLLELLNKYEEGSPAHKIYMKRIEADGENQIRHYMMQAESLAKRQQQVIDGVMKSKEIINNQAGEITKSIMDSIEKQLALSGNNVGDEHILKLGGNEKKLIGSEGE